MGCSPERLGIFGGTFDPPHIGHLAAAMSALVSLSLVEVWLVVAHSPWQKAGRRPITAASTRLDLVARAVEGLDGLRVSNIEILREGPSYSIETVEDLHAKFPGREIVLILGADAACSIDTWHRSDALRELCAAGICSLAVLARPGAPDAAVPAGWQGVVIASPALEVSSSMIRTRVRAGRPIGHLVPREVHDQILALNLYRR